MKKQFAYKFQLMPKPEHIKKFYQFAGCQRFVWNKALALQKERLDRQEGIMKRFDVSKLLPEWKKEHPFLKDVQAQTLQRTVANLDRALWESFNPKLEKGFPEFKRKGKSNSFGYPQGFKLDKVNHRISLPKIGWVRFRGYREVEGTVKNVIVSEKCGKWYVSIQVEMDVKDPKHPSDTMIGIDVGIAKFATCSDGEIVQPANAFRNHEKRLAFLMRGLSRKQKFSSNWKKQKRKVARFQNHIANIRKDFLHKASHNISKNHAVVVMEDLKVSNMSKSAKGTVEDPGKNVKAKSGLNKSILDQGWYEFRRQLEYKLRWQGGYLLLIDPRNTSRKCSVCGHTEKENRKTQERFECQQCGHIENADLNASKNILAAGLAVIACGGCGVSQPTKQEPAERTTA